MTRKVNTFYLCWVLCLSSSPVWAQQTAYVGLFPENWVFLNPAFIDHSYLEDRYNYLTINSSHREQWIGFEDAPSQTNVRFEHVVKTMYQDKWKHQPFIKWGLGFTNEKIASYTSTGLQGNFAYYLEWPTGLQIGAGLNVGIVSQGLELNQAQFENWALDQFAQALNDIGRSWWFNGDVGISLIQTHQTGKYKANGYYLGFSAPQTFTANIKPNDPGIFSTGRPTHFNLLGGILFERRYLNIEPSVWVRNLPGVRYYPFLLNNRSKYSVDSSIRFSIKNDFNKNQFWVGGGYSTAGYINLASGFQLAVRNLTRYKGGLMVNVPLSRQTFGRSIEVFLGLSLAHQK